MIQQPEHVCSDHMQIIPRTRLVAAPGSSSIEGQHRELFRELIDEYFWPGATVQPISDDQSKRRTLPTTSYRMLTPFTSWKAIQDFGFAASPVSRAALRDISFSSRICSDNRSLCRFEIILLDFHHLGRIFRLPADECISSSGRRHPVS